MMRKRIKFPMLALGLLAGGLLTSCSTENEPAPNATGNMLVKAPQVVAYSGGHLWTNGTRSAYMNANMYDQEWDCVPNVNLTDDELAELIELFKKGEPTYNDIILPFENYWVQQVYKGTDTYTPTDINGNPCNSKVTGSDQMDKLVARNQHYEAAWVPENNYDGSEILVEYEHVNNFNSGNNTNNPGQCGCGIVHEGTTLMINMSKEGITPNNQFGFHESYGTSHNYNNYIIIQYKGEWYVGFDYEMHKDEAQNPNEAKHVNRDWNFTDWIVKITPAYHKGMTPEQPEEPVVPGQPEDNSCDKCEHPKHEGENCPDCEEGTVCNPKDDPEVPEEPGDLDPSSPKHQHDDEVEINLGVDQRDGYKESHLSIHVRSVTDVEVFIPVPAQYYCDADDMAIVLEHADNFMIHGGPLKTEFDVNGTIVTLNLEFVSDGIRIWTDGIDENVINFCREKYDDGITFEVWNYFNDVVDFELLKSYLNQATVRFLDKEPGAYINAYGEENWQEGKDCKVDIVEDQRGDYNEPVEGTHLNNSAHNQIYDKK